MFAAERRPRPRIPGLAAAAGGLIAFAGFVVLLDRLPDTGTRVLGAIVSALVVAVGFLVLFRWDGRPARTAGVVLSGLGIVPFLLFVFIDPTDGGFDGFGLDLVDTISAALAVAAIAWLVSYLIGPGKGASFYLAAALVAVWAVLMLQVGVDSGGGAEDLFGSGDSFEEDLDDDPFSDDPFSDDPFGEDPFSDDLGEDPFNDPSVFFGFGFDLGLERTPLGVVSLLVGATYVAAAAMLDRRRHARSATPFAGVGDVALFAGILLLSPDIEAAGASALAVAAGAALIALGALAARRFTAWLGAVAVVFGTVYLVEDLTDGDTLVGGIVLVLAGAGLALAANLLGGSDDAGRDDDRAVAHAAPGAPDTRFERPPDPF